MTLRDRLYRITEPAATTAEKEAALAAMKTKAVTMPPRKPYVYVLIEIIASSVIAACLTFFFCADRVFAWWLRGRMISRYRLCFMGVLVIGMVLIYIAKRYRDIERGGAVRKWLAFLLSTGSLLGFAASFFSWIFASSRDGDAMSKLQASFKIINAVPGIIVINLSTGGWLIGAIAVVGGSVVVNRWYRGKMLD
jgi:hypothetical protein